MMQSRSSPSRPERNNMNAPEKISFLPDIQSQEDMRNLRIDAVGVKGVRYPISVVAGKRVVPTVATLSMTVGLAADAKGTHMSRFIELAQAQALDPAGFKASVLDMLDRLEARGGTIEMLFPYFVKKTAPVSGVQSLL